eukprot:3724032-Pyramimonas_sp.AAC.1
MKFDRRDFDDASAGGGPVGVDGTGPGSAIASAAHLQAMGAKGYVEAVDQQNILQGKSNFGIL